MGTNQKAMKETASRGTTERHRSPTESQCQPQTKAQHSEADCSKEPSGGQYAADVTGREWHTAGSVALVVGNQGGTTDIRPRTQMKMRPGIFHCPKSIRHGG